MVGRQLMYATYDRADRSKVLPAVRCSARRQDGLNASGIERSDHG